MMMKTFVTSYICSWMQGSNLFESSEYMKTNPSLHLRKIYVQRKPRSPGLNKKFSSLCVLVSKFSSVRYLISIMRLLKPLVQERPRMTTNLFFFLLLSTKMVSDLISKWRFLMYWVIFEISISLLHEVPYVVFFNEPYCLEI